MLMSFMRKKPDNTVCLDSLAMAAVWRVAGRLGVTKNEAARLVLRAVAKELGVEINTCDGTVVPFASVLVSCK